MNGYSIKTVLTILLGGCIMTASAQSLTLEQCREKALKHNRSLTSAKIKAEQMVFDMRAYKANFFPQVSLVAADFYSTVGGDFTISGGRLPIYNKVSDGQYVPDVTVNADGSYTMNSYVEVPSQTIKWKMKNMFVGGVSLMEPIYAGGKITTAYKMSKLGVGMSQENVRLTTSEVIVKTDEAYYLAVKAKELGDVARSYKSMLEELKRNVEAAFRYGMSTRNDVMKVQVKLNEAELSVQKADNAYRLALMNLCHIIGLPLDSEVNVEYSSDILHGNDLSHGVPDNAISSRPEYSILHNKAELAHQNIRLVKSEHLPNVMLGAAYTYANGGEISASRLINNSSATFNIAVKVPIDIFGGAANKVRSANASYQIAQLEQQEMTEQMLLELTQCRNNMEESVTEVRICETALEQATENVRLSKQQYEVGLETLSDYLETQALWQQCSANLVNARCQLALSRTKLLKASGGI